jgi:hypothetical protein
LEIVVNVIFFIALFAGVAAGSAIAVRDPTFWVGVATEFGKKAFTAILNLDLFKRMSAENEKKKNDAYARGEEFVKPKRRNPDQKW